MDWHTWVLFVTTVFFLSATPGPNMLLALSHGIRFGPRKAVATGIGTIAALMILMVVSVTGLGALLAASETAFSIVKWCGVAYLLFLGVKTWRAPGLVDTSEAEAAGEAAPKPTAAWKLGAQAFLVCFSNPKAIVFFVALFPQFLETAQPLAGQVAILAVTFAVCEFLWIMTYATGGGRLVPLLKRAGFGRLVNRLSGGMLIGAGALLAVARRM
ncbi:putative homoserine/homoserine lactone efflux protein [Caenispirillum salinarum AK4]|uniref:Putative homoserine/homoserine lactone efflux protein n=1 Tax=Caenispirillum salinarum AK4 TaxID=1238182 RepID=K9GQY5_9PROT|nr:LysE family translocator [Caenispirillum salinarum]EKV27557.1 putative homoserine/homoserine lactone efflux protein [Caenispirillum salinarum AK4]